MENLQRDHEEEKMRLQDQLIEANTRLEELGVHRDELHQQKGQMKKQTDDLLKSLDDWKAKYKTLEQESKRKYEELANEHVMCECCYFSKAGKFL